MWNRYEQLTSEQRNQIQRRLNEGLSIRVVAKQIDRSPSTVSREARRGLVGEPMMWHKAVRKRRDAAVRGSESWWKGHPA